MKNILNEKSVIITYILPFVPKKNSSNNNVLKALKKTIKLDIQH